MKKLILFGVVLLATSLLVVASFGDMLNSLTQEEKAEVFECWKTECHGLKSETHDCKAECVDRMFVEEPQIDYYDDFSVAPLDLTRWIERTKDNLGIFTDEHLVTNGVYHVAQYTPIGRSAGLVPTRQFNAGEVLEYDIVYNSGSGNNIAGFSRLMVNGNEVWLGPYVQCTYTNAGCGIVGYWNGETNVGREFGTYHFKMEFFQDSIISTATRPDGTTAVTNYDFSGSVYSAPYSLFFTSQTGHDGMVDVDYDNFLIS